MILLGLHGVKKNLILQTFSKILKSLVSKSYIFPKKKLRLTPILSKITKNKHFKNFKESFLGKIIRYN